MESIAVITASELSMELSQEWFCDLIFCKILKKQDFSITYWDSILMRCYIYHMQDLSEMLLKCLNIIRKCLAEFAMWNQYHNNCNLHFFVIHKIIYCIYQIWGLTRWAFSSVKVHCLITTEWTQLAQSIKSLDRS